MYQNLACFCTSKYGVFAKYMYALVLLSLPMPQSICFAGHKLIINSWTDKPNRVHILAVTKL